MNIVDKFILKISSQVDLMERYLNDDDLSEADSDKLESLLEEDFRVSKRNIPINDGGFHPRSLMTGGTDDEEPSDHIKEVSSKLSEIAITPVGSGFSEQLSIVNRFNAYINQVELPESVKIDLLYNFYIHTAYRYYHLITPLKLHNKSCVIFKRYDSNVDLPKYEFEDVFSRSEIFGRFNNHNVSPITSALLIILFEKSPTELMKFAEFICAIENVEQLKENLTLNEVKDLRESFQSKLIEQGKFYYTYQEIVGVQLLSEIIYSLEEEL